MVYKLSPSSINLMLDCPRCFWLQIVKKIKRPETPFPSLPSGMDKILKEHFDRFMEKNQLPPEIKEYVKDCKLFNDKEKLKVWRNNLKGIEYKDEENDVLLHLIWLCFINSIFIKTTSLKKVVFRFWRALYSIWSQKIFSVATRKGKIFE